jgi:hypothetical protein
LDDDQKTNSDPLLKSEDEEKIRDMFLNSSLLPCIESALRTGSILEMAKELELFLSYFRLIELIAKK